MPQYHTSGKKNRIVDYLDHSELRILLNNIENSDDWETYMMVRLMVSFGFRISELLNLRYFDVRWEENAIQVRNGKGHKDRIIYCIDDSNTMTLLRGWLTSRANRDLIFQTRHNRPYARSTINDRLLLYFRKAGILRSEVMLCTGGRRINKTNAHPHTLRHTMAVLSLIAGQSVKSIAIQLGHSEESFTMRTYLRICDTVRKQDVISHPVRI